MKKPDSPDHSAGAVKGVPHSLEIASKIAQIVGILAVVVALLNFYFEANERRLNRIRAAWELLKARPHVEDTEYGARYWGQTPAMELIVADGSTLHSLDMKGADLSGIEIAGADLSYSILRKSNFAYSNLSKVDLTHASLECVIFTGAELKGTKFNDASIGGADFRGAKNITKEQIMKACKMVGTEDPKLDFKVDNTLRECDRRSFYYDREDIKDYLPCFQP